MRYLGVFYTPSIGPCGEGMVSGDDLGRTKPDVGVAAVRTQVVPEGRPRVAGNAEPAAAPHDAEGIADWFMP